MMYRCIAALCLISLFAVTTHGQTVHPYDEDGRPNPDAFDWTGVAVGGNIGTLGVGADATIYLGPNFNFRASASLLPYETDDEIEDIDFDIDVDFTTVRFLIDFFPSASDTFRFTAGLVYADNTIDVLAAPTESEKIGDNVYTPAEIGTISGSLSFDEWSPYLGIGFGNSVRPDAAITAGIDIGVMFQQYSTDISADGSAAPSVVFEKDIRELESDIDDDLDGFKVYPVITVSVMYHF